jgi:hypothetical protein
VGPITEIKAAPTQFPMDIANYFIEVQHRPRRVAFFVDPTDCPDELADEIVDFNLSSWGGRYNPIIPVFNGQVTDSYWKLLSVIDPDLIYTYCNLPADVLKRIATDVQPLDVLAHRSIPEQAADFRVRIDRQATVLPVLRRITSQFPVRARKPDPTVLVFDYNAVQTVSHFIHSNFGASRQYHVWCRDHEIPSTTMPTDDKEIMKALASNRNLILPIDICAEGPRKLKASTNDLGVALTLCYGTSAWNFVEYWNLAHFRDEGSGMRRSLSTMWMAPDLLEDRSFYEIFINLIRQRIFVSGGEHYLRLVSYDEPAERMRDVTTRICTDFKWNLYPSEPIVRSKGELPSFEATRVMSLFVPKTSRPRNEQMTGNSSFLELSPPVDAPHEIDERWIAEFAMENPQQERYFENKTAWWKVPRKDHIAGLFVPQLASRVGNDHLMCAEVSGQQQGILLKVPQLSSLFRTLVLPEPPGWARRFETMTRENLTRTFYVRSSDKGMYARGVLGLFETLQKAGYVFEHDFWRTVIESLSSPVASEHTRRKVRNDLERIDMDVLKSGSGLDFLVDEVLDTAGRMQRPTPYASFQSLWERYWSYIKDLPKDDQFLEVGQVVPQRSQLSNEDDIRGAARANLRDMLSEMTARKIFLQGTEIQCNRCLASLWYHVDDLRSIVICRGCRKDINLRAEVPWSYSLNELVASAVGDHGVAPVIRTAFRLFKESRECFCFLPGIEVRDYKTDPETQVCELDLVWIRDGEFGAAEIKRTPKKLSVGGKLATLLGTALPDRFLLVSTTGTFERMQEICSEVKSKIDSSITVEAWNPADFAHSADEGWNTIRHSLLG